MKIKEQTSFELTKGAVFLEWRNGGMEFGKTETRVEIKVYETPMGLRKNIQNYYF